MRFQRHLLLKCVTACPFVDVRKVEFFTISDSARSGSDRYKSELSLSAFEGIKYLLKYMNSSKGQSAKISINCKILIVIIPEKLDFTFVRFDRSGRFAYLEKLKCQSQF